MQLIKNTTICAACGEEVRWLRIQPAESSSRIHIPHIYIFDKICILFFFGGVFKRLRV